MTLSAVQKAFFTSCALLTDITSVGRVVAVSAAETLDLRDVVEGLNARKAEAEGLMKLFGQIA